jgi:quercetin dioxygenase-like cupin family protein
VLAVQIAGTCMVNQVGAGRAVFIPAGAVHRVDNGSLRDAVAVGTYTLLADVSTRVDAASTCPG